MFSQEEFKTALVQKLRQLRSELYNLNLFVFRYHYLGMLRRRFCIIMYMTFLPWRHVSVPVTPAEPHALLFLINRPNSRSFIPTHLWRSSAISWYTGFGYSSFSYKLLWHYEERQHYTRVS